MSFHSKTALLGRCYVAVNKKQFVDLHVECPIYLILTKFGFSRQTFVEATSIKFHANRASGSHSDTVDADRYDKLIGAFRDLYERGYSA
jgi:predicted ATPase